MSAATKTRRPWRSALGLVALAVVLAPVAGAAPLAKSTFKDSIEGSKVVGDTAGDPERPTRVLSGGAPGAYIEVDDAVTGGVMYWRAPAKFLGNKKAAYKGTLSYKQTQSAATNQFLDEDLILTIKLRKPVEVAPLP